MFNVIRTYSIFVKDSLLIDKILSRSVPTLINFYYDHSILIVPVPILNENCQDILISKITNFDENIL